jgi:hypothetical protein
MPKLVVQGAALKCTFGASPARFAVTVPHLVDGDDLAAGSIADFAPTANIPPFGLCRSPKNPQVATATSAAGGTLTPQPCVPALTQPWSPGSTSVSVAGQPGLHASCTCRCQWGGVISITNPGQAHVDVD